MAPQPARRCRIEHRAWIALLEAFLKGERDAPPPLDHHCRFDRWLDVERLAGHGVKPAFQTIEILHRRMHALGVVFCELHAQGRSAEALARLGELYGLRDDMFEQLSLRVQSGWSGQ